MDLDLLELERRLAIGFNEYLSLKERHALVIEGEPVDQIMKKDSRFKPYFRETRDVISWLSRSREHSIIWYGEKSFPSFRPLRSHLPYMIFCRGTKPDVESPIAAIVGTRHATYQALHQAFRLGYEASLNEIGVISGFAEGVDQSSMKGALESSGQCIGVLACGHDVEYPSLTRSLRDLIVERKGCILSRFAPSTASYKSNFLSRNMIIAAYCDIAIAVQAPRSSGTLNTCDYAIQMGKELFIATEGIGDKFVQYGTNELYQSGAPMIRSLSDLCGNLQYRVVDSDRGTARFGDRMYMATTMML